MPTQVLIAIGALSIALAMLGWALFSRPSRAHQHAVANLQRGLRPAGRPAAWPMERLLATKLMLAVIAAVLGLLYVTTAGSLLAVVIVAGIVAGAYFLPELLL